MGRLTEHQAGIIDLLDKGGYRLEKRWRLHGYTQWRKVTVLVGPDGAEVMTLHSRTAEALEGMGYTAAEEKPDDVD
jgi:hypothetical protein